MAAPRLTADIQYDEPRSPPDLNRTFGCNPSREALGLESVV